MSEDAADVIVENGTKRKGPLGRSPSYPAIDLQRAIERARVLYSREKQYATPVVAVVQHWGYKALNGPAGLQIAALKKYGLLTDEGAKADRRVRLTDLAVTILNHPNDAIRAEAIRKAALEPTSHRELRERYPSHLPSDANLEWELTREQGFTENGARDFIKVYKATMAFAGLDEPAQGAVIPPELDEPDEDEDLTENSEWLNDPPSPSASPRLNQPHPSRIAPPPPGYSKFPIPLPSGHVLTIEGPFKLSESDWMFFRTILDALKPSLARPDEEPTAD